MQVLDSLQIRAPPSSVTSHEYFDFDDEDRSA
jgi:hypothetical protein